VTIKKQNALASLANKTKVASDIAKLLEENNIPIEELGKIKMNKTIVNKDGVSTVTDRTVIELHPSWFDDSQVLKPAPDMGKLKRQKSKTKSRTPKGMETAVIIPDIQVGYYDYSIEPTVVDLQPIHDEKAISIGLAVISDLQPELIVMNGDNLDFEEVGKYDKSKAYERMLQPAIDRMAEFLRQLREAAPSARIVWIEGNHEKRLQRYLNERAPALVGIRKGKVSGEGRSKYPIISVSELCRVEDFDVEYLVGYPASRFSINKNLYVIHGDKVNSSGSTAGKYLPSISQSVIYGHIHRMELSMVTRVTEQGSRTVMAASFGTWCRIDGAVPSVKGGQDEDGRPVLQGVENWQQGIGIITYEPHGVGHEWFYPELMWIIDGRAVFRGKEYIAE